MTRSALSLGLACLLVACGTLLGVDADAPSTADGGASDGGKATDGDAASSSGDGAPDANVPFAPSHIAPASAKLDGPALSGIVDIDTGMLFLKKGAFGTPEAAPYFFADIKSGAAVLVVASWTVDFDVIVHGSRSLVVVAAGDVDIAHAIDAGAKRLTPGPGGSAPGMGTGAGGKGHRDNGGSPDSGGGGGGFGIDGATGQPASGEPGGSPGKKYGDLLTDFLAGSGGGKANSDGCDSGRGGSGGAGGGALQISARGHIRLNQGASINVGGGGGKGGCQGWAAGGGGSGGLIFLEAVGELNVAGILAANGGGGGGGGGTAAVMDSGGSDGKDGDASAIAAKGGGGDNCAPCYGGDGAVASFAAKSNTADANPNGGGGGGGVGRIWLRTRAPAAPVIAGTISPPPRPDATF